MALTVFQKNERNSFITRLKFLFFGGKAACAVIVESLHWNFVFIIYLFSSIHPIFALVIEGKMWNIEIYMRRNELHKIYMHVYIHTNWSSSVATHLRKLMVHIHWASLARNQWSHARLKFFFSCNASRQNFFNILW